MPTGGSRAQQLHCPVLQPSSQVPGPLHSRPPALSTRLTMHCRRTPHPSVSPAALATRMRCTSALSPSIHCPLTLSKPRPKAAEGAAHPQQAAATSSCRSCAAGAAARGSAETGGYTPVQARGDPGPRPPALRQPSANAAVAAMTAAHARAASMRRSQAASHRPACCASRAAPPAVSCRCAAASSCCHFFRRCSSCDALCACTHDHASEYCNT